MGPAFDLIIFDCDGTLVDSEEWHGVAVIELLRELGVRNFTLEHALESFVGLTFTECMSIASTKHGFEVPKDIKARYMKKLREMPGTLCRPVPGAIKVVMEASRHSAICVASNGERENVLHSLTLAGLKEYFADEFIFDAAMVAAGKPAPDLFLYAAERFGARPERCLVLEDSGPGVMAGKAASMTVFGFTGTAPDPVLQNKKLLDAGADKILSSLESLINNINDFWT